jgi:hypothetical protein
MLKQVKQVSLLLTLLFTYQGFAQVAGGNNQKLFDMYVLGDYEKCADKAIKLTENDNTKYESEPYLWVAMCMIKLNEDPEMQEYYPDAIKDALKFGAKFKKRDDRLKEKEQDYIFDENIEFMNELKEIAAQEAKGYFVQNDFRKAVYWYKMGQKLDPDDATMQLIKGVTDLYNNNKREGQEEVDAALAKFREMAKNGSFEMADELMIPFEDGFIYYAEYLKENGDRSAAAEIAKLARELDPENKKFERLQENMGS